MKQNSQWLSQVRTWSNSAELTPRRPSGSPVALRHLDGELEPAPAHLELDVGLVGQAAATR